MKKGGEKKGKFPTVIILAILFALCLSASSMFKAPQPDSYSAAKKEVEDMTNRLSQLERHAADSEFRHQQEISGLKAQLSQNNEIPAPPPQRDSPADSAIPVPAAQAVFPQAPAVKPVQMQASNMQMHPPVLMPPEANLPGAPYPRINVPAPPLLDDPPSVSTGTPPIAAPQPPSSSSGVPAGHDSQYQTILKPLWGLEHKPTADAVFGLMFGYAKIEYQRFVGSLRKTGYTGDIVLATSKPGDMRAGVENYLKEERVLSYPFGFACKKKGGGRKLLVTPAGCQLTDWYADGDQRDPRPLALIRYEHYRSWLNYYSKQSWILILDTRDTFFQLNPFSPSLLNRNEGFDIHLFEENRKVKRIGICPFNSGWLGCWGREIPKKFANNSVVCSGSTLGHRDAVVTYVETMIGEFDSQKCHVKRGTESDQGYHNYLYHTGTLASKGLHVKANPQGTGVVNTIGAMNGFRVPENMKGPLDTFWKIRDAEGYILNNDGSRSPCVHQWDRFAKELLRWLDKTIVGK